MKLFIFLLISFVSGNFPYTNKDICDRVYSVEDVEVAPIFDNMESFVSSNLNWPSPNFSGNGYVICKVLIGKTGSILNIEIKKGLCKLCDEEAVRVIRLMDKWKPAQLGSCNVYCNVEIPIEFSISK